MAKLPSKLEQLAADLQNLSDELAKEAGRVAAENAPKRVRQSIEKACEKLHQLAVDLDPIKIPEFIFDPSSPHVVGRVVGIAMIAQPRRPLAALERFYGAGIYAIYYKGDFSAYRPISQSEHPIYVGKADPVDPTSRTASEQGDTLFTRLGEHKKSIERAEGSLRIEDFDYRALVVQSGWQVAAEYYLINLFRPIWNREIKICYGIGKHGDSSETRGNRRSPWDTLHPGRKWANSAPDGKSIDDIVERISHHFNHHRPLATVDEILELFLQEMRQSAQ